MISISLQFDLRSSPSGASHGDMTAAVLDICEWADRLEGVEGDIRVLEHHGSTDGYNPSPITLAAAIAGRTRRLAISAVVLLPFYQPLRLAEDLAILDLLSRGRVGIILSAGYRRDEFKMFGIDPADRGRLMEEGIAILKQAWTGEPFEYCGKPVRVTPRPFQRPRPPIIMGGSSKAAARRAARIADGFVPTDPALLTTYRDELIALGKDPGPEPSAAATGGRVELLVAVSDDPDATWQQVGAHCLYEMNTYASWLKDIPGGVRGFWEETSIDALRQKGRYLVVTPEDLVRRVRAQNGALRIQPLIAGISPEIARRSISLIESQVLPHLR